MAWWLINCIEDLRCQFLRTEGATWSAQLIPRPYSRFSRPQPLLFFSSSSSIVLTRVSGPCSQEIW
jgi:hypothetical protein